MKTTLRRLTLCGGLVLMLVATQTAYAFYAPGTQRWITRDPIEEGGFELFLGGGSFPGGLGPNLYSFVRNDSINGADPLGLCDIKIRCGPVKRGGITLGVHCGVIGPDGSEYGLGGGDRSSGSSGTASPYQLVPRPPGPSQTEYPVSCPNRSCQNVQSALQRYHDSVTPPPYNALGPNSDTYAHNMLNAAGCSVKPIGQPPTTCGGYGGIWGNQPPPTTTPPGTTGW